jgi:PAS domain S-box-containing protein
MMPNTALALLLVGSAGAMRHRKDTGRARYTLSVLAVLIVLAIGGGTLAEYALGADLHIDQLLFRVGAAPYPGRPSPPTALALTLLAVALLLFDVRPTARVRPSEWLILSAGLTAFAAFVGFVLGAAPLYRWSRAPVIGVSLPTAVSLLFTSAGLLLERPAAGIMRVATSPGPGGMQLRRLALPIVVTPVLLGFVVTRFAEAQGIEELEIVVAVLAATMTVLGLLVLGVTAVPLNRVHEALESSRTRIRDLVEQAPDGIFVADLDGRYTDVNEAGCNMLGYTREEIVGKTIIDLIPPGNVGRLWQERENLIGGAIHLSEWTLRRKDGSDVPVEVSAKILPDGRWQAFVRDISERRRLEVALRGSHADLVRAQSVANVGSWRLDVRHNTLQWSDEEYRIFEVAPGTPMTYEAFLTCVHPDDRAYVEREWAAARGGQPFDIEHRIVAGGAVRWVREKADLEFDENHTFVGGIGVTVDITERRQREEQLRQTQERLDLALRGADLALWDWNVASGEVVFNQRWAEMRGYRPDEVRGHVDSWISAVHPEDWPQVQRVLEDHFQGRRADYEAEHRVRTKSGQWIWILDRGKVFARNERGEPTRMLGTELDITSRKQSEDALRLAEARAAGILSISADAIISIDEHQRITLLSDGAEKIFGYAKSEVIGQPLGMLIPNRFREVHRLHVERFAAGDEVARRMGQRGAEIVGIRKNGQEFPADAAISKLEVGGRRILTVALRDITERKRVEDEHRFLSEVGPLLAATTLDLDETLSKIARIAVRDLADVCIVDLIDHDGMDRRLRVVSRDPSMARVCDALEQVPIDRERPNLTGTTLETKGPILMQRPSPEDIEALSQTDDHLRALKAIDLQSLMLVPLLAHGKLLGTVALISVAPSRVYEPEDMRVAQELANRAALAIENARLYGTAQRATQMRDEVLRIVAHDLRGPLAVIVIEAGLLRRRGPEPERRSATSAEAIKSAAARMNRLIQDLLDVARMEAGRLHVEPCRTQAVQIASHAVETQRPLASAASLDLRLDVAQDVPDVWADRDRLLQVFENLIGNALKFTESGGRITVGAAAQESEVLFWVADTGSGIAAEDQRHLFDQFWQARKNRRHGVGLGLPIVKGIVQAHGGRVWIESTPGRGSTFFFTIPTATRGEVERPEPAVHRV